MAQNIVSQICWTQEKPDWTVQSIFPGAKWSRHQILQVRSRFMDVIAARIPLRIIPGWGPLMCGEQIRSAEPKPSELSPTTNSSLYQIVVLSYRTPDRHGSWWAYGRTTTNTFLGNNWEECPHVEYGQWKDRLRSQQRFKRRRGESPVVTNKFD